MIKKILGHFKHYTMENKKIGKQKNELWKSKKYKDRWR